MTPTFESDIEQDEGKTRSKDIELLVKEKSE